MISAIKKVNEWFDEMAATEPPNWDASDYMVDLKFQAVLNQAKNFETILKADLLENLVAYHPQRKAIYSTTLLIAHAENTLHPQDLKKVDTHGHSPWHFNNSSFA